MATKVAAITGGARGIGLAYATALLQRSPEWRVALLDVAGHEDAATKLCTEHGAGRAIGLHCDVADAESFKAAFAAVQSRLGPVCLFINNAGVYGLLFSDMEKVVGVNLLGALRGTELAIHAATKGLTQKAEPPLDVICTSSSNGLCPADSDCAITYCATKFGINGMVRSLAFMGPRFNVRVTAVCPVTVETPMTQGFLPPEVRAYLDKEGRGGVLPPEACAQVMLRILDTPHPQLSGEVLTVHPAVLQPGQPAGGVISLETGPGGQLAHLGTWQASKSEEVAGMLEPSLAAIASGEANGWSTAK